MKSTACLVAAFALTVCANASVELFFTASYDPYGLRVPSLAFLHTAGNGTDYRDGYELTKGAGGAYLTPPLGPLPDVLLPYMSEHWAYIWGRFNNEPVDARIDGVLININGARPGMGNIAWYVCDNRDQNIGHKRWDGDSEVFYANPTGLMAVTAYGIPNANANVPWDLYAASTRTFLLGAVRCPEHAFELTIDPSSRIHYRSGLPDPTVKILNMVAVPEPAGVLLLAAAGLVALRR